MGLTRSELRKMIRDIIQEDLDKWFKEKWVDISRTDSDGDHPPCGASAGEKSRKGGEGAYPKCVKTSVANKMSDKEKKSASSRKRSAVRKAAKDQGGDIDEPVFVSTKKEVLSEKNVAVNKKLWSQAIAQARRKFDVYPSAYANGWAVQYYNKRGGKWKKEEVFQEAEYKGKTVTLNKPFRTPKGPKKFAVYVKNDSDNVVIVRFGDPNMEIKRDDPDRKKSFRARHNCDNPGPKWKARYWSCKFWDSKSVSDLTG